MTGPPSLAAALVRFLFPRGIRDEAMDDLDDLYHRRLTTIGKDAADRWYRQNAVPFALRIYFATLFGGSLAYAEATVDDRPREAPMHVLLNDLRYALRAIRRSPGFSALVILTFALGIGANAAIFSVVRTVLLRPLPFPEPERLVGVWEQRLEQNWAQASFTHANFWDVRDQNRSLEAIGAVRFGSMNLTGQSAPERLSVGRVTTGFFGALRPTPIAGRLFTPGEDAVGAEARNVVLSHAFWVSHFGSQPSAVGQTLTLDGEPHRVIGVLPGGTPWLDAADVFAPLVQTTNADRGSFELQVVARLKRGVTQTAAIADLNRIAKQLGAQYPDDKGMTVTLEPSGNWVASDTLRRALWVLMSAVGFLLLIACVNIANMLLARATSRVRERALRAALGATRGRVVQLALIESLVLAVIGGSIGVGMASVVIKLLGRLNPGDIPRLGDVRIDGVVIVFTLGLAVLTSLLTGLIPAARAPFRDVIGALREGERSLAGQRRGGRLRQVLVGAEVALSLMLLVGSGLLIRSFNKLLNVERGFAAENRFTFQVSFPEARTAADAQRISNELVAFQRRLEVMPQVLSAAAVSMRPLRGTGTGMGFDDVEKPLPPNAAVPWASWRLVTRDYFKTMGLSIVAGRDFTEQDIIAKPWRVVISKRIADQLWPKQDAVGKRIILWRGQGQSVGEVIGVASNMRDWSLEEGPSFAVYIPYYGSNPGLVNVVVHANVSAAVLVPTIRAALSEIEPTAPLASVQTLSTLVNQSVASRRFAMMLLAALSLVALVLAMAGVYGVLAYSVSQRRPEIGMRIALGATRWSVLSLVMSQGMQPVVLGLLAGIAGAAGLSRFMRSLLFDITSNDLATYGVVSLLLAGSAALACYLPAREAVRVDVLTALREE